MTMNDLQDSNAVNNDELLTACTELKRCISRLSYVGMGASEDMDQTLKTLRDSIKHNDPVEQITDHINSIGHLLRLHDEEQDAGQIEVANNKIDLLNILLKRPLPKSLKKNLTSVKSDSSNKDASQVMHSIAEVIETYISQLEPPVSELDTSSQKKNGFMSSLFGRSKAQKVSDPEFVPPVQQDESLNFPQELKVSLQQLISQLASMDGYSSVADGLKVEIDQLERIEQLSSVLEMITSAFVQISDQEHVQFETFLKTLNSRIVRVNDFINQTLKYSQDSSQDSQQLNLELSSNISGMKDSLTNSSTLDEAKSTVFNHMDSIVSQINHYCSKQEASSEVLIAQMDKLSEQLRATEDEASRLKDDLAEQRVRAQTDPLTKLPNRYSYNERLTQEYNRWRRYRNSLTLVVGDIDLFKRINDQHGHSFGDKVLIEIANFLTKSVRESDFIARFGGEEFIFLLPETSIVDATRAINKIRSGISKLSVKNGTDSVSVSMSFGISEFENDDTTKAVFERADKALYRAKEKGRNRVCCQRAKSS
ncbi:MAG: GGDEF domain-containing protein [Kangiellaceae bacterium]|nr:GGDEF domain-containing protein [Kangiellaceae bacterium]